MCLEGFSIALCFILYTFKFDTEGIKQLKEFENEKDFGVNILGYGVGLLVPSIVILLIQTISLCTKLYDMKDECAIIFHKYIFPPIICGINMLFSLVAAHKCFQKDHVLHSLFITFIFFRLACYIYEILLTCFDLIPYNSIGLGNDIFFLHSSIQKSEKRIEEARRNNIKNIEKENRKLKEKEERENTYQENRRLQIQKIEDEEQAARTARKVNIQNKIDEEERKREAKEQEKREKVELRINLATEGARLEQERARLEEERKEFEAEKAMGGQHRRDFVREGEDIEEYLCPITLEIMREPVVAADGRTYERVAITNWLLTHDVSPVTNLPMSSSNLIPNIQLKNLISKLSEAK